MNKLLSVFLGVFTLTACAATSPSPSAAPVISFYDYQFATPEGQRIELSNLPRSIANADVVLVGEWHTHSAVHRFQTDLLKQLSQTDRPVTLSMEQFSRPYQAVIDNYLASEIGERTFIKQTQAWPNYESDYRPLIELAKRNKMAVIASNAPKSIVRCIGREGIEYLDKLDNTHRSWIANEVNTQDSPYKSKFMASMHHGKPEQTEKHYAAQITWDETMAESIVNHLAIHPTHQVMHVAGKFHTEGGLGIKASILRRNPELNVVVITPVTQLASDNTDFQLLVLEPPQRYVKHEHQVAAYQTITHRNKKLHCQ